MIVWLLKILLILLSISGLSLMLKCIDKRVEIEYCPLVIMSSMSVILILCAYLNVLMWCAFFILIVGIASLVYLALFKRRILRDNISILCFIVVSLLFAVFLCGTRFASADSYSHWAVIVRRMLTHDALPTAADRMIQYQSYPVGISALIYFFCRFIDGADDTMAVAQNVVMLAGCYALFAPLKKNKKYGYPIITIIVLGLIFYNTSIRELLVDTLLPIVALSILFLMLEHKEENRKVLVYETIILSFCAQIKGSGLYFIVLYFILTFIVLKKDKVISVAVLTFVPSGLYLLWSVHVKNAFPNVEESNHAISVSHYLSIWSGRLGNVIVETFSAFMRQFISIGIEFGLIVLVICVVMMTGKKEKQEKLSEYKLIILVSVIAYVLYMAFLLAMYLFSMEDSNPQELVCMERYRATIELELYGMWIWLLIKSVGELEIKPKEKLNKSFWSNMIITLAFLGLLTPHNTTYYIDTHVRDVLTGIKAEYRLPDEESFIVYINSEGDFISYNYWDKVWDDCFDPYDEKYNKIVKAREAYYFQYIFNTDDFVIADEYAIEDAMEEYPYRYVIWADMDEYAKEYNRNHGYDEQVRVIEQ